MSCVVAKKAMGCHCYDSIARLLECPFLDAHNNFCPPPLFLIPPNEPATHFPSVHPVSLHGSVQFVRGDMYVRDMSRTSGHTGSPTAVDWNPLERDRVLSSSRDGSARVWNLNGKTQFDKLVCDKVFSAKNSKGQRTNVTAVTYHPGGREFVLGTSCGSLQVWNATKVTVRPERAVFDAHGEGKAIQSLRFNGDGTQLASRADDGGTVQVWGYRKISRSGRPVTSCPGVPNADERPTVSFSPDGKMLVAGSFVVRKAEDGKIKESGKVKIFKLSDAAESKMVAQIKAPVGVFHVVWHPKLNQILAGCSDGRYECLPQPLSCAVFPG